jgi:hypothetical protein
MVIDDEIADEKIADKPECNYHFLAPRRNCIPHCQALQDLPDMSQVSLNKYNKINLPAL